jgi:hypothetical protein
MDRQTREAWIDQLRAESAESLLAIAERETRAAEMIENQECDALLERCAERRQQADKPVILGNTGLYDVIYKEFPLPPPEPPPQMLATQAYVGDVVELIGEEVFKVAKELRAEFAAEIGALRAEIEVLRSLAKTNGKTRRRG